MQQVALIQSGCQQWIRQPAAIHGSQYFAFSSSLAVFVHAAEDHKLLKILTQPHTKHINALCWSPVDPHLLACSNAEKAIKVYSLETEAAVYASAFPFADRVALLRWATHDEGLLLAAAGSTLAAWSYKGAAGWHSLHSFKTRITCMQQSATEPRLMAVGCADGSMLLFDMLLQKVVCSQVLGEAAVPCDLQFDPLSKSYLLLLCSDGSGGLYAVGDDLASLTQVSSMGKQPGGHRCAAFVPNAPGNFAVVSGKSGSLQVWNVSQPQPLQRLNLGKGAAQSLAFFPGSGRALITFQSGTVLVYDVEAQSPVWSTPCGHTETIFDCSFAPAAPGAQLLLATCSFDGSVRVWDAASRDCIKVMETSAPGREARDTFITEKGAPSNALYSVGWSPDATQLAASSAGGDVWLFDLAKGIPVKKIHLHTRPSLRVTWHPTQPSLLASSSLDGSVVAFQTDGSKVKVLQHSSPASGCAWAPHGYQLATTSDSGAVYVWDLNLKGTDCLVHTLTGHAQRSFSVLWSPLLPNLLLSGSDDATARVWDVASGCCLALLSGHTSEVRALCWHPELPWLVLTGSWDSTIRCWDWRRQCCVHVCSQHHSDVYGLAIPSSRPWLLASTSRDSTLRLWDLRGLATGLLARCFLTGQVPCGQAAEHRQHAEPLLCGSAAQQLSEWCAAHGALDAGRLSAYFSPPGCTEELWQLAAAAAAHLSGQMAAAAAGALPGSTAGAAQAHSLPLSMARSCSLAHASSAGQAAAGRASSGPLAKPNSSAGDLDASSTGQASTSSGAAGSSCTGAASCLCHLQRVRAGLVSAANQLELSVRSRGVGRACVASARKEEALQAAAALHLQAGDVERCCELLVEVGVWDQALAIAPAVSLAFWQQLLQRRADAAIRAGAPVSQLLPQLLATGQTTALIELLVRRRQHDMALNVAAVAACGGYTHLSCGGAGPEQPQRALSTPSPPPPRTSSLLSPSSLPAHPKGMGVMAGGGTSRAGSGSLAAAELLLPARHEPGAGLLSPTSSLPKRNSLPPLRCTALSTAAAGGAAFSGNSTPGSPSGAAAAAAAAAAGVEEAGAASPPAVLPPLLHAAHAGPLLAAAGVAASTGTRSDTLGKNMDLEHRSNSGAARLLQHHDGSLHRTHSGALLAHQQRGAGPGADAAAWAQLVSVCTAQTQLHRLAGQPLRAACAALVVHDVPAAVTALHLGNEPEQAAMLCTVLGCVGGVDASLADRVFEALARKCEAAGDWAAAVLALSRLSSGVQHQLELLAVRSTARLDSSSASSSAVGSLPVTAGAQAGVAAAAATGGRAQSTVWQQLGLLHPSQYAAMAGGAADAMESVRCLLLAGEHGHAAAKAVLHMQPLLEQLMHHLVQAGSAAGGISSRGGSAVAAASAPAAGLQLLQLPTVLQLLRWQVCLDSLAASQLPAPCWAEVFAHTLLAGALKAFGQGFWPVGSYLLRQLWSWLEQRQVHFALGRAALMLLEAIIVQDVRPEAATSLLIAAADSPGVPGDIKAAARQHLQVLQAALPRPGAAASSGMQDDNCVVAAGSSLVHRPPVATIRRSAVSGQLLQSGPWALLDDGCSLLGLSEAVMLGHVMRFGPCGTGLTLQLL